MHTAGLELELDLRTRICGTSQTSGLVLLVYCVQVRQIIVIRPPVFLGTVRLIRGQGRLKVRLIRGQGRFSSELRFDQKYRKALTAFLCVD